jgi:hypothetical protein
VPALAGKGGINCTNWFIKINRIYGIKSISSRMTMECTGMDEASIPCRKPPVRQSSTGLQIQEISEVSVEEENGSSNKVTKYTETNIYNIMPSTLLFYGLEIWARCSTINLECEQEGPYYEYSHWLQRD